MAYKGRGEGRETLVLIFLKIKCLVHKSSFVTTSFLSIKINIIIVLNIKLCTCHTLTGYFSSNNNKIRKTVHKKPVFTK